MSARRFWTFVAAGWLALGAAELAAQDFRVGLTLEPNDVAGLDEAVLLEIKLEGAAAQSARLAPSFQLENFRQLTGPSQATSLRIVNGVPSTSRTLTWQLQPLAVGTARVFGVTLQVGGEIVQLPERSVRVVEKAPEGRRAQRNDPFDRLNDPFDRFFSEDPFESLLRQRPRSPRQRQLEAPQIFLRAEAQPQNPYVGQQVLYTVYLFTETDVHSIDPDAIPEFKGFWAKRIPQPEQLRPEMVETPEGVIGRVVLLQWALFPRRAGTLELEPVAARLTARVPDFTPLGSVFPRSQELERKSNSITLSVRDLPPPPAGFDGTVGQVALTAELAPQEVKVGEAATLTLTLSGRGHLGGVQAPPLPALAGIKVFPPQQQSSEEVDDLEVEGTRTWSFVLVPERPGEWQVPAIHLPYFDPDAAAYRTAATAPLSLVVRGTTSLVAQDSGERIELHPIRTAALPAVASGGAWSRLEPWLFVLPWGLAAVVLLVRRRGNANGHGPVRKRLLDRLAAAAREERPRQAAADVEEAWRDYLLERWAIPRGTPSTQWGNLLLEKGAPAGAGQELVQLADDLHYLRYAPKLSSVEALQGELVERSRKLVRALG